MKTLYDHIGEGYDITRQADPFITRSLSDLLHLQKGDSYVDIACGTGNYTTALSLMGGQWTAVDQSGTMLQEARKKNSAVTWIQASAERTGLPDNHFDGALCTLALHHFSDLRVSFEEIVRILKPDASLVVFTATPEQMESYWLSYYFPEMMRKSCEQMYSLEEIDDAIHPLGLSIKNELPYFVTPQLKDFFLFSGKHRAEMYLSEKVRSGISSFRNFCTKEELQDGLLLLEDDIETGRIERVIKEYYSDEGDYMYLVIST